MVSTLRMLCSAAAALLLFSSAALAQTFSVEAFDNATVQSAGPRSGSSGKTFFNVQGSANGSFASFAVADFQFTAPLNPVTDISAIALELVQSNASFTADGAVSVYWTEATSVSIQAGDGLEYQSGFDGLASVDPLLAPLELLASSSFVEVADGTVDRVDLLAGLSTGIEGNLINAINAGGVVRLVVVPEASTTSTTSATWAGFLDNFDGPGPTLTIEAVGGDGAAETASNVCISEFHYDNEGTDVGEFVELAGDPGAALDGWTLQLYNGTSSQRAPYDTITFNASDALTPDSAGVGVFVERFPSNGIQNGAPDGLALADPAGNVIQFLSYEGSFEAASGLAAGLTSTDIGVAESSSTPAGFSLQRIDGMFVGPAAETPGETAPGAAECSAVVDARIYDIQGAGHSSPLAGAQVRTSGVVTQVGEFDAVGRSDEAGFYLQDAAGDGDIATSDGIFVISSAAVAVGDEVQVIGTVEESGFSRELTYTRINASEVTTLSAGNALPAPIVIGASGRSVPTEVIEDDDFTSFDPTTDGADFFESLEGMLVEIENPLAISGTNRFGELFVVSDFGASASGISTRGTLNISPDDFNPERIQLDPGRETSDPAFEALPFVDVGALLDNVIGTVGYDFGNFQVQPVQAVTFTAGTLNPQTASIVGTEDQLSIASYNVLNLDPNEADGDTDLADGRFAAIAEQIVSDLATPDVLALQEIQDNSGSVDDGVVAADLTLQTLVDAIVAAGGPDYAFIDNTFITNNNSGGQPGANIRTAFLYNAERVELVPGSVRTVDGLAAFAGARLPLIASFEFNGETVTVINNHFSSKGGSAPIFGTEQPFEGRQEEVAVNGSLDERQAQSAEVQNLVTSLVTADSEAKLVVLGDLNEFEFVSPVAGLESVGLTNLTNSLPENERYSFIFQGNSQSLDHILVSDALLASASFEVVHANVEFAETPSRASDHDPLIVGLQIEAPIADPTLDLELTVLRTFGRAEFDASSNTINFAARRFGTASLALDVANTGTELASRYALTCTTSGGADGFDIRRSFATRISAALAGFFRNLVIDDEAVAFGSEAMASASPLAPGESSRLRLDLRGTKAGSGELTCSLTAEREDGSFVVVDTASLNVVAD